MSQPDLTHKKKNCLSQGQTVRLALWLEKNGGRNGFIRNETLAVEAEKLLGFEVTASNVRSLRASLPALPISTDNVPYPNGEPRDAIVTDPPEDLPEPAAVGGGAIGTGPREPVPCAALAEAQRKLTGTVESVTSGIYNRIFSQFQRQQKVLLKRVEALEARVWAMEFIRNNSLVDLIEDELAERKVAAEDVDGQG